MGSADANNTKIAQPTKLIAIAVLKTAGQLCVSSRIWPARYTPRNPGTEPAVFIRPKTLPEKFGAKSCGFMVQLELWKPEAPIIIDMQSKAAGKLVV